MSTKPSKKKKKKMKGKLEVARSAKALDVLIEPDQSRVAKKHGVSRQNISKEVQTERVLKAGGMTLTRRLAKFDKISDRLEEIIFNSLNVAENAKTSDVIAAAKLYSQLQALLPDNKKDEKHLHLHSVDISELNSEELKKQLIRLEQEKEKSEDG